MISSSRLPSGTKNLLEISYQRCPEALALRFLVWTGQNPSKGVQGRTSELVTRSWMNLVHLRSSGVRSNTPEVLLTRQMLLWLVQQWFRKVLRKFEHPDLVDQPVRGPAGPQAWGEQA